MTEDFGIDLAQMTENAGPNLAGLRQALAAPRTVIVTSCVRADATMTLALPKTGLAGSPMTGRLYLADISVPLVYQRMGLGVPVLFRGGPVVELKIGQPR
jgi:hypothetical protein